MEDREFRELVGRVKLRSPIEAVVAERVPELRRKGSRYWACCPFHEERTPSFCVDPERGTWHCFGACGEGGDAIAFVERFDGLPFLDALRLLAQACGEAVPERLGRHRRGGGGEDETERLHEALSRAERLYARLLFQAEGRRALAYARGRGFTDDTLEAFGLGWAPPQGNPVLEAAGAAGFPERLLIEAGLVRRSPEGRAYDFFHGRLMIPICDRLGRTVGFGGRLLPGDEREGGKYVNTGETTLFKKSRLIFALDAARDDVRRSKRLVLMEGYTDVMAAHQAGFANAAAVLGTATTDEHAALVRRVGARRVTLVFDGDEAGRQAGERALHGLLPNGVRLDVVPLPPGKDPCDVLLAEGGADAFRKLLDEARDWFAFSMEGLRGLPAPELAAGVDRILSLLERLPSPVERDARLVEMARFLELPEAGIRQQAERHRRRRRPEAGAAPRPRPETAGPTSGVEAALGALVGACLLDNSLIPAFKTHAVQCPEGDLRELSRVILELHENGDEEVPIDASAVLTALGGHPARELVVPLVEQARTAESPQTLARDQLAWLERRAREEAVRRRRSELADPTRSLEEDSTRENLRRLHRELRRIKVPSPRTPSDSTHPPI